MKITVLLLASALSGFALAESTTTSTTSSLMSPNSSSSGSSSLTVPGDTSSSSLQNSNSLSSGAIAPAPSTDSRTGSSTNNNMAPAASDSSNMNSGAAATTETTSRTYREETVAAPSVTGGFYIEPGLFGSRNENSLKTSQLLPAGDVNGRSEGVGLDLKIGGHLNDIAFLALDGRYERARFSGSNYQNADSNIYNYGPTLGFQAPIWGMRLWGTYVLDGVNDPQSGANNVKLRFTNPYGWRGGIGFHIQSVSLNLEYEDLTYRTTEVQSIGTAPVGSNTKVDFGQRGYLASLSFPISL